MSESNVMLHDVISTLQAERLLDGQDVAEMGTRPDPQPWYVRAMVGFGAWLASLLLIGFVASFSLMMEGGYAFVGLALIAGAILLRRSGGTEFLAQCALAGSLAGQALLAYGVAESLGHEQWEIFLGVAVLLSAALFLVFPDRVHRILMVMTATASLATLLYLWEMNAVVPVLGPILAAALVVLHRQLPELVATRFAIFVRPLMDGLMLSAFGVLLLSTVYILPELNLEFRFYPRPWISTLLLGGLFLYLGASIWPVLVPEGNLVTLLVLHGVMVLVVVCAWAAPGLLLGLIVVMLGASCGRKSYVGAGIGFFAVFLATYFYGIEVSMETKAAVLATTGLAILLLRWVILRMVSVPGQRGLDHA